MLRTDVPVVFGLRDAWPRGNGTWGSEPQVTHWGLGVADPAEGQDPLATSRLLDGAPQHALGRDRHRELPSVLTNLKWVISHRSIFNCSDGSDNSLYSAALDQTDKLYEKDFVVPSVPISKHFFYCQFGTKWGEANCIRIGNIRNACFATFYVAF